jgi:H+/Cl- antiporter ClcA
MSAGRAMMRRHQQRRNTLAKWIGIGLAVLGIILVAFIVAGYIYPDWAANTRDIAVVILAVFQLISVILMIALLLALLFAVFYIRRLARDTIMPEIRELRAKLDGVIDNTRSITGNVKDTTASVSTTTVYMAERVVSPVIRVSGLLAGVRAAAIFLARRGQR